MARQDYDLLENSLQFNSQNNLQLIARAHQLVMEGYKAMFNDALVTVWSAPNYCYRFHGRECNQTTASGHGNCVQCIRCGNVAAILGLDENLTQHFTTFREAPQDVRGVPPKNPAPDYFL